MRILLCFVWICLVHTSSFSQGKRKLVWSDEFNYNGPPDSTKWAYELGFIRNQEKQYYTTSLKNVSVRNGVLEINAIREQQVNEQYNTRSDDWRTADSLAGYTSASINTLGKASWTYGKIEARARIPKGAGIWPAIWMMGINRPVVRWPACGEIDIMEFVGHDSSSIFGSIHFAKEGLSGNHGSSHSKIGVIKPYDDFHVYSLEWDEREIKIFFDNELYHTFQVNNADSKDGNPFRKPFYLLLNLALGGSWGGTIDDKNLPQSFLIDYIRVYQ